ncbi:hypothetical protein Tco_0399133, partial [Tanacetum coccineum]
IMQVVKIQGKVLQAPLNFSETDLSVGLRKSRKVLPSPLLRQNTSLCQDVVLKSYGCVRNYLTMASCLIRYLCTVTIKVLSHCAVTVCNIQDQSTLISVTTS